MVLTASLIVAPSAMADTPATVDPPALDLELAPGDTQQETVTVELPAQLVPPKLDVYLLADTTRSMLPAISGVQARVSSLLSGVRDALPGADVQFGVGDFLDFAPGDPYAFRHSVSLTAADDAVRAGIDGWGLGMGGDGPEGQFYAYDQIAEDRAPSNDGSPAGTIGWRDDASRVLVVFADAPAHDPICSLITTQVPGHEVDYDITEASVIDKLVAAGITFVGISTTTGGGMDAAPFVDPNSYNSAFCGQSQASSGQATRLADATGGEHVLGVDAVDLVDVIVEQVVTTTGSVEQLTLEATGDIAPFVRAITPDAHGPFTTDEPRSLAFTVDWLGVVEAAADDQVFTGTLDVVADGATVASQSVQVTVPGEQAPPPEPPSIDGLDVTAACVDGAPTITVGLTTTTSDTPPDGLEVLLDGEVATSFDPAAVQVSSSVDGDGGVLGEYLLTVPTTPGEVDVAVRVLHPAGATLSPTQTVIVDTCQSSECEPGDGAYGRRVRDCVGVPYGQVIREQATSGRGRPVDAVGARAYLEQRSD